jgi:mannose/fructose/N-acetylgalactosamine-specific phosphotransferase system component IIB
VIKVAFCRIDDRLIHGQVVTQWLGTIGGCDGIWIVDDGVRKDPFLQNVLRLSAPKSVKTEVFSLAEAVEAAQNPANEGRRILILVKVPATVIGLLDGGIPIPALNVGGMGSRAGRAMLYRNIAASPEEIAQLASIEARGCPVTLRPVPADAALTLQAAVNRR